MATTAPNATPCGTEANDGRRIKVQSEAFVRMQSAFYSDNMVASTNGTPGGGVPGAGAGGIPPPSSGGGGGGNGNGSGSNGGGMAGNPSPGQWQWHWWRPPGMFLKTKIPSALRKPGSALASASCVDANHAGRLLATALMALLLLLASVASAWAQDGAAATTPPPQSSSGIKTICPNPNGCFASKEEKDNWAAQNNCQFLEDVCEKTPPSKDNQGANNADAGFWENFFTTVKNALVYGYEFTKGLMSGLKEQVTDIISLITNIGEVIDGLVKLGKAFYDDPKGTMAALAEMLGQDVIDTITKATQCGAYDLGKVIGKNISPATMVKLAANLSKYSGKVAEVVKITKKELGCASFTAGTWIHTRNGLLAIQTLRRNDWVHARDETHWLDAPQRITSTFGRLAPSYRELQTEFETFELTDEHPLWVQGKGWTEAKDVSPDDVLAAVNGDTLVRRNTVIQKPVAVYNFSVANTPNYFVGESGVWAHNAKKCDLPVSNAPSFEQQINKPGMFGSLGERQAFIKIKLTEVAKNKGWIKDNNLTKKNNREVYKDKDGNYWAFDTQHGRFEKINSKGKHQGEFDIDLKFIIDSIEKDGSHDIIL